MTASPRFTPQAIRKLAETLRACDKSKISAEEWNKIDALLDFHKIEAFEYPSHSPGDLRGKQYYGNKGASPKQLEIQQKFFTGQYRLIAAAGANRSGKTESTWRMCLCKHLRDVAKQGERYWLIAPNFGRAVDGPMRWLWEGLPREMFGDKVYNPSSGFGVHKRIALKLPDGRGECSVDFKTTDQGMSDYESVPIHGAAWTECDKEAVLDALIARTADYAGFLLLDYVPTEFWQRDRLKLAKNPKWLYYAFAMAENAHNLPEGEPAYQQSIMTPDEWAVRGLGKDRGSFGVVYHEYREEIHRIKPFRVPDDWPRWRSLDYGGSAPTACVWGTIAPAGFKINGDESIPTDIDRLVIYREYYRPYGNVKLHAANVKSLSSGEKFAGQMLIDPHAFDRSPANPMSVGQQYTLEGLSCRPWPRARKHWGEDAMVDKVKMMLVDRTLLIFDTCEWLNKEFQTWRYKVDNEGKPDPRDTYDNKNNHALDAMRGMACMRLSFTPREASVSVVGR